MKYLVTGGAGFIGSNLTDELIAQGHSVKILDNLSTGRRENINPAAEFILADITKYEEIAPRFSGMDGVFHFAALPRVQISIENPRAAHDANINGTFNVFLAAKEAGVKRLVYSASSSAYGDPVSLPLKENMLPRPLSPYGLQKYVGEHYARLFSMFYGLETVSLRYFNVYGPRMAEEGAYCLVIAVFLKQRREGKPLTICGDGTQTRDFTHVRDVVAANILAMTSPNVGRGEVINIGAGSNHSVKEIADLIGGKIQYLPPRVEPHDTLADNTLARELLGWEPKVRFTDGVRELLSS